MPNPPQSITEKPVAVCIRRPLVSLLCISVANQDLLFLANICLDPDAAYSYLIISKDTKCVQYGYTQQKLPDSLEKHHYYNPVLSSG